MQSNTPDSLFQWIESTHQGSFGDVLDAGTGAGSLRWLNALPLKSLTAVTAESWRLEELAKIAPSAKIVLGQWTKPTLLQGESFDVVLADYLIGALDGHAPFYQYRIIPRLRPLVRTGGLLYLVGMEPPPIDEEGEMAEIVRLRDACILLGGRRCYREYPKSIVTEWLTSNGFEIVADRLWPNVLGERYINGQLNVAKHCIAGFRQEHLKAPMQKAIEDLRMRALARGPKNFGADWTIAARRIG
jgi:hypothetical protein